LKSDEVRELSPDASGKLQTILVEEGASVKKGDLLAVVDHETLTYDLKSKELQLLVDQKRLDQLKREHSHDTFATLESDRLAYEDALRDYTAKKQLFEVGAVSDTDLKEAESEKMKTHNTYLSSKSNYENEDAVEIQQMNLRITQAEIEKLKHDIEKSTLVSPIDGTVTDIAFKELDLVSQSDVIFTIEDMSNLKVTTHISEFDIGYLSEGQSVDIKCDGIKDKVFEGKVSKIAPVAQKVNNGNSTETTVAVEIDVLNEDPRFKSNFSAEIEILTQSKKEALVIPYEAIYFGKDSVRKVFVVEEETIVIKPLEMGVEGDLFAEVTFEGITEDAKVVMNPSDQLTDGDVVTILGDESNDKD